MPIIISGGSGKLGRIVLKELLGGYDVPANQIIITTRTPDRLAEISKKGVVVREGDYDKADLLPEAFEGGKSMLLISTYPEDKPKERDVVAHRRRPKVQCAAIDAAIKAGVEHIVYTSAPNPEPGTPCYWLEDHYETEKHLIDSGTIWTILRNGEFPDWHLENDWIQGLKTGAYYTSRGAGKVNHIWREDCGKAAAGALVKDVSANRRFELTGPESLTAEEIMSIISDIAGKPINVTHCSQDELRKRHKEMGLLDANLIEVMLDISTAVKAGRHGDITNAVEILSGKKPSTLRAFLQKHIPKLHL